MEMKTHSADGVMHLALQGEFTIYDAGIKDELPPITTFLNRLLALTIDGLIGDDAENLLGATGLSTVPSVLHEIRVMLDQYWPKVPHVLIEPGVRTGIPLLVDNPKEVGADRIVNCLAAYHKYGTAAIVVDFGSSICVDVVSAKGEFLGGAIAPGVQVSSDAAAARSAALRRVELTRLPSRAATLLLARLAGLTGPAPKPGAPGRSHPRNLRVLPNSRDFH